MSLLIKGMDMPKQTDAQTDKGMLKLWTIRNWKVGQKYFKRIIQKIRNRRNKKCPPKTETKDIS